MVIGITEVQLKKCKFRLRHQDVTLLGLEIWEHSTGKKINECFENISRQVGVPLQIVVDGGSDINKGTRLFCEKHFNPKQFSDLSHKLARLLEKHLKDDDEWNLFVNCVSVAKAQSQQTPLAYLTPPARRTQARYMNLHTMIRWAVRMLKYKYRDNFEVLGMGFGLDEQRALVLEQRIETELAQLEPNQIEEIEIHCLVERLRGLVTENPRENRAISLYSTLLQMVEAVEVEIKTKGLNRKSVASSQKSLIALGQCERSIAFARDIMEFLEQQVTKVPIWKNYLGSTNIIESLIGKFKLLNQRIVVNGINQSALLFGSIMANITPEKVKTAMETVPWS